MMIMFRVAEVHQLHLVPLVQLHLALALAPHALPNATIVQGDDRLAAWTWVHLVQAVPVARKVVKLLGYCPEAHWARGSRNWC